MSNADYQIQILEALRIGRRVQRCRRKPGSLANPWIEVKSRSQLLNFDRYIYRIGPITDATWLVYDTTRMAYLSEPPRSAQQCTLRCIELNDGAPAPHFMPVKVVPDAT